MHNFVENCLSTLESNSRKVILHQDDIFYTGHDLCSNAKKLAAFFYNKGMKRGDRIAVELPNCIEFVLCYFAAMYGNFTLIPINHELSRKDKDYILEISKPKFYVNCVTQLGWQSNNQSIEIDENHIFAIFFTSGTTNKPKGVCHSAKSMLLNATYFNELVGLKDNTAFLHCLPMGYMAGFLNSVLSPLLAGGSVTIGPQFNAKESANFWNPVIKNNINTLWLTPTIAALLSRLNRSNEVPAWTTKHLNNVFIGTAPLSLAIKNSFEAVFGIPCYESYGMTEVMLVSSNSSNAHRVQSVGKIIDGILIQIRDQNNRCVNPGEQGVIYIKSPYALQGYLNSETNDLISPTEEGWLNTGDMGYVDTDGSLFITARLKDLIIRGGVNISPRAIEEVLLQHPAIQEAAVVGKPHDFWGEQVVAFISVPNNSNFSTDDLVSYCKAYLNFDAIPSEFILLHDLPRSSTGKIQKEKLRELL